MEQEYDICKTCGETKPLTAFWINKSFANGHSPDCLDCRPKAKPKKPKAVSLCSSDLAVLKLLRNEAGLKRKFILARVGEAAYSRVRKLIERGFIETDGGGYYSITQQGRDACPYRNRHLEAKRLQRLEAGP